MKPKSDFENTTPLFELRGQNGHVWKLYENGRIEGFPDGTVIINRAVPLIGALRSRIKNFPASGIANDESKIVF